VRRALIDPTSDRITGFVVSTGRLLGRDVIVGEHAFVEGESTGVLTLRLSKAELEAQPSFEESDYVPPPGTWAAPVTFGLPPSAYLWPVESAPEPTPDAMTPTIKKGDTVKDRDGDVVGVVHEIRFDDRSGGLTGLVVKVSAGLERLIGAGEIAEISHDDILRIVAGEVRLAIDREEIVASRQEIRRP
jgi:sporulation protein YlmC with PRC-barrel domain